MAVPNKEIVESSGMKRKHMSQNPTGMLWGSNSPSLKPYRNQDNSAFGDFGKYMTEKKRKLSLQFQDEASNKDASTLAPTDLSSSSCNAEFSINTSVDAAAPCRDLTKLFVGISIFVDGFTTPSHQELRNLMIKHGGMFENYFSRDVVTHIICSTLPDSKIRDHRSFSRGLPIVKPSWVVDSISCGKVQPISLYSHERIARNHPNQRCLSDFLDCPKGDINEHLSHEDIVPLPQPITRLQEQMPLEKQVPTADNHVVLEKGQKHMSYQSPLKQEHMSYQSPLKQEHMSYQSPLKQGLELDLHSEKELELDLKLPNGSSALEDRNSGIFSGSVRSHCTLGDANFVQNYFKNSRLHFIGTWRTRYQNRFHGSKVDKDQQNEKLNSSSFSSDNGGRIVMHVDMDCFFVSVVARNRPELAGKPVAVCHSEKTQGTAEISSSNYAARAFGVKSGMFIRDAKALCPELEVVPYDFEGYEQVADQFYDILHKYCKKVQAISCDEAYLDVTGVEDPEILASIIRKEIVDSTRCTASVGIAGNLLLARMATRKAKPDGQYKIASEHVEAFLSGLSVEDLPGVGWSLQEKLHSKSIYNCMQLRGVSKEALQRDFGLKTGDMLWCYARGIDHRQVQNYQERKSIGAEVNWGVRFDSASDAQHFLTALCGEVSTRLQNALVTGRTFTLKIKKRKEGAGEPQKFMGCGSCDNLSKSVTLGCATNNVDVLLRVSRQIFASFHLDVREIRGMGLQVTKLESNLTVSSDEGQQHQKALESCLEVVSKGSPGKSISKGDSLYDVSSEKLFNLTEKHVPKDDSHVATPWGINRNQLKENKGMLSLGKVRKGPFSGLKQPKEKENQNLSSSQNLPQVSELDHSVLASLPLDILAELDEAYNGAVAQRLSLSQKPEATSGMQSVISRSFTRVHEPLVSAVDGSDASNFQRERDKCSAGFGDVPPLSKMEPSRGEERAETSSAGGTRSDSELSVPLSLSQIDMATLEELPTQLREDILRSLPAHRPDNQRNKHDTRILTMPERRHSIPVEEISEPSSRSEGALQLDGLWSGAPPKWVFLFKSVHGASAEILHLLCIAFLDLRCPENFSSVLLHAMRSSKFNVHDDLHQDLADSIAFRCCLELLKQYLTSKVSHNLEEVFMIVRVVKRLAGEDQFWERICESIIPFIQAATGEVYGGTLYIRA